MSDVLRLLRYNTGTDKKVFVKLKDEFDAVIFNATIVAYSGSSVADLVSAHKHQFIIDPQTHIFQHDISAIQTIRKKAGTIEIKKSVEKYLDVLPSTLKSIIVKERRPICPNDVIPNIDMLADAVYQFETTYVQKHIENKEYDKYLAFANITPAPRLVIAPYFMLKSSYSINECTQWMQVNRKLLDSFALINAGNYEMAAQLVLDQKVLIDPKMHDLIRNTYSGADVAYIFLWVDELDTFESNDALRRAFYQLLVVFRELGIKPIMAYGGYDSIFLCNHQITNRLFGVAQSVGYGESRAITPVGGGLPVNKYYFEPIHRRLKFEDAFYILQNVGYFDSTKSRKAHAKDYYAHICTCPQCRDVIQDDIDNFNKYNDSIPFVIKARYGDISRNRPTSEAGLVAAFHFSYCKAKEWQDIMMMNLDDLVKLLIKNYEIYMPDKVTSIKSWCDIYAN